MIEDKYKIFNDKNISDLPESVRKQLKYPVKHNIENEIMSLFEIKEILNTNEIIIALYRKFKKESYNRHFVSNNLARIMKKGLIRRYKNKKGWYEIVMKLKVID